MKAKSKAVRNLIVLTMAVIMVIGNMGISYADSDSEQGQHMIYKDGEFIWVDNESAEAEDASVVIKKNEIATAPYEVKAKPTNQKITVDGKEVKFRAYNISGYNYFMLRDLAYIFNGTKAQFEVGWDGEKFAISLDKGKPYTGKGAGFDMKEAHIEEDGYKSKAAIYKDGKEATLLGYTIQGYTYFKLRDLGDEMGFGVEWDAVNQTVVLLSDKDAPIVNPIPEPEPKPEEETIIPTDWDPFETQTPDIEIATTTENKKQSMREEILGLVNKARAKEGLKALVLDVKLNEVAEYKSEDMKKTNTFSHDGSYGGFTDLMAKFNISYGYSGENIVGNVTTAEEMFTRWWESPGHRANMMNPKFRKIGIGFADDKVVTHNVAYVPKGLENQAVYNKVTGVYTYTAMSYLATQEFTD